MDNFNGLKRKILEELEDVTEEDYVGFMAEAFHLSTSDPKLMRVCMNKLARIRQKAGIGGSDEQGKALSSPPVPKTPTKPAWELPMIFRGDMIPTNGNLFIDVEKISEAKTHRSLGATVAVVNEKRDLILWAFIKREGVCQFFPKLTKLSKSKVDIGIEAEQIRKLLNLMLDGNTVYGAAVAEDLKSLDIDVLSNKFKIVDIQEFYRDGRGPLKLADVARAEFPEKENFQCGQHSAISDARMTQKVAKRMLKYKKDGHEVYPKTIQRSSKIKKLDVGDRCTCGITSKKYRKKKSAPSMDWRDYDMA